MRVDKVKVSVEIDRNTDLDNLMISLRVIKKLVKDLGKGLDAEDLAELMAHNGLADKDIEGERTAL